jgi:periplasmic protein TonB
MASMSGAVPPAQGFREPAEEQDLFRGLVVSDPGPRTRSVSLPVSIAGHVVALALVVLVPILWPYDPPPTPDIIARLIYNPPPPPPPPLPKGAAMVEKPQTTQSETKPEVQPDPDRLTAEIPEPEKTEALVSPDEQAGDPNGQDDGVLGGDEQGVSGGVLGGTVGGVIGGVIGGTGDGPVMDYDQAPRLLQQVRPQYPQEAFVKKIEGTVELEIVIDASGHVSNARVTRSIPLLDAAAVACVKQWRFAPAIKNGRPVPTVARAPVTFRIF